MSDLQELISKLCVLEDEIHFLPSSPVLRHILFVPQCCKKFHLYVLYNIWSGLTNSLRALLNGTSLLGIPVFFYRLQSPHALPLMCLTCS
jgi:hypothetical protein